MIDVSNKSLLIKLSNYPQVVEFLVKCNQRDIDSVNDMLVWSSTLVSNIARYNSNIFLIVEKTTVDDRACIKNMITWPTGFVSQLLKTDMSLVTLLNKIDTAHRTHIKEILEWSSTLTALLSKDQSIFEFLIKLSDQDRLDLSNIANWAQSTISLVKNTPDLFKFLVSLTPDEIDIFKIIINWSQSTLHHLIDADKKITSDYKTHMLSLYRMWDVIEDKEQFFKLYMTTVKSANALDYSVTDAFSKGQVESKLWLIAELENLKLNLGDVWTLCGWIGSLAYIMLNSQNNLQFNNIRSFDIDKKCAGLADQLNKTALLNNWRFKASTFDVNSIRYENFKFATVKSNGDTQYLQETANTVINTSCDHMNDNTWWERVPNGTLVILQNNNFLEKEEHVNIVTSITEFKNKYPMRSVLYEGELDCNLYTRYMLIGRK
jgi:hypothetical protein